MVILDLSIVNVALPSIQSSLGFSSPDLQWVVNAYAITFAGCLLLGGRVADRFGQRRMFVLALVVFGLASLVGGLAPDGGVLIGARAAQGLGAALMAASSLAIITSSFPPGPALHRAIATWAAMNGLGGAAGVLLGGIITQALTWRWILLINPPIAVVTALVAYVVVRDRRRAPDARFDVAGAVTLTVGQMVLVYGVVESGLIGWHAARALGAMIAGLALLGAFVVIETQVAAAPLIPFKESDQALADGEQHRAAVQRSVVPDVVRELPVPAAGARALAAAHRSHLPAHDPDDHAGRLARRQARGPLRGALGARQRADHADRRDVAARRGSERAAAPSSTSWFRGS